MSSGDEQAPVMAKKKVVKVVKKKDKKEDSGSEDDAAPVQKTKKVVKKPAAAAAPAAGSGSEGEAAPVARAPGGKVGRKIKTVDTVHVDPQDEGVAVDYSGPSGNTQLLDDGKGAAQAAPQEQSGVTVVPFNHVNYDEMSFDGFLAHLKTQTKIQRMEEYRLYEESKAQAAAASEENDEERGLQRFSDDSGGYTYKFLLDRIIEMLPREANDVKIKISAPKIEKFGSKRTVIANFDRMCQDLNRDMEDVKDFIEKQLTIQSSIDSNNCLLMRIQNVKPRQIEQIFQKYIQEYVQCNMCHSIDTELIKDHNTRLTTMKCGKCKATRTVSAVSGATFQAQTAKRARIRIKQL